MGSIAADGRPVNDVCKGHDATSDCARTPDVAGMKRCGGASAPFKGLPSLTRKKREAIV
jgi:hypothetical protein